MVDVLREWPFPCAVPHGLFLCKTPADSPYLPWAGLFDLLRKHSVYFGDQWPELTSLQMVSK